MKRWQLVLLVSLVIAAHSVVFMLVFNLNPLPKTNVVPPPNFVAKERSWVDKETGERFTLHEYKVSTKLAMPDVLMEKAKEKQ